MAEGNGDAADMNDVSPVTRPRATTTGPPARQSRPVGGPAEAPRSADRAEFSKAAQLLSKLAELPDVRQDLIDQVRAEITAGTYETPEKLDQAIEKLMEDLA